ncbi:hypothetical protein [Clostridium sp.]
MFKRNLKKIASIVAMLAIVNMLNVVPVQAGNDNNNSSQIVTGTVTDSENKTISGVKIISTKNGNPDDNYDTDISGPNGGYSVKIHNGAGDICVAEADGYDSYSTSFDGFTKYYSINTPSRDVINSKMKVINIRLKSIDTIAPLITITTPVMGDDKVGSDEEKNVMISGTTEPEAKITMVITDKYNKSVNNLIPVIGNNNGNYSVNSLDVSGLADGELTITATAEDTVGNSSQATKTIEKYKTAPEVNIKVSDVTGIKDTYEATAVNFDKRVNKILNPNITLKGESFADINVKATDVDFFKYQFITGTETPQIMPENGWSNIDLNQETTNQDVILEQKGHLNQRAYDVSDMPLLKGVTQWSNSEEVFKTPFDATTYKAATYSQTPSEYGKYEDYLKSDGTKSSRWVTNSMFMKNMDIGGTYKEASKFWGYIKVPTDGNYSFGARSDDGCRGYITVDGETKPFVNMFVPQGTNFGTTNNVYALKSDKFYPIYLEYFNWGGSANFELRYSSNGSVTASSSTTPTEWFYPSKNITPGEYATTTFSGSQGIKFPVESNDYYIAYKTGKGDTITKEGFYGPFTVDGNTKLSLSKAVVGGNTVEAKENFILEYNIQPGDIVPRSTFKNLDGTLKQKIYLNGVKLQDEYPQNIEIKSDANDANIVKNDQKITVQIPNIEYILGTKDGKSMYSAQPVKIQIPLSAKRIGNYILSAEGKSIITYVDVNDANAQMEFGQIEVKAIDTVPAAPTLTPDETKATRNVTVTVAYPEGVTDGKNMVTSIDGGAWVAYNNTPLVVTEDATIEAKYENSLGTTSAIGSLVISNIDQSIIKTGLFINNKFVEKTGSISIVTGFTTNVAFQITNLKNKDVTLEMDNSRKVNISEVKVYSTTNFRTPIKTLNISGNTVTITGLPNNETNYVFVFKATGVSVGTVSDVIKFTDLVSNQKQAINVVKLPLLQ